MSTPNPLTTLVLGGDDMATLLERVGPDTLMDLMIDRLRARYADLQLMDLMIDRLRARYADLQHHPVQARDRDGFRYDKPALGLLEWMPTHEISGPVTVKMVGYHPTNPFQRHLPSVIATTSMWDTQNGHLVAIADATLLTAIRTGAASALATDLLARQGPIKLGVVGLGAQAVTQVHAISRVRSIDTIVAIDADDDVAATFAERIDFVDGDVEIQPADGSETIAADVDVLCTCTSVDIGDGPVIGNTATRPWLHVNAVGADFPGKTELPHELLTRAFVVPDVVSQCVAEGECQQLRPDQIGPELVELSQHPERCRTARERLTVYDSTGWAVQDAVALQLAVELAQTHDLGDRIHLELIPTDPHDPYSRPAKEHR